MLDTNIIDGINLIQAFLSLLFQVTYEKCPSVKGCVRYIFASLFFMSKMEHFRNKEKCFLFHFESSFHS